MCDFVATDPKYLADIRLYGEGHIEKASMFMEDQQVFQLTCNSAKKSWFPHLPVQLDLLTVTPKTFLHSFGRSTANIRSKISAFDPEVDECKFFPTTEESKSWDELGFIPWLWFDIPNFEAVLRAPHYVQ